MFEGMSDWISIVIVLLEVDVNCSVDMYLYLFLLLFEWGIDLYFKDELVYLIGLFKYCFVCFLFFYGFVNGCIWQDIMLVELLSGLIVVFEVYFV